jgi:hypothetical protein
VHASATLELNSAPAPYFAGGSGISWLSDDIRVFQVEPGVWRIPSPMGPLGGGETLQNTGNPTNDATSFIQSVINQFNADASVLPPPNHPFDVIPTGEDASALDTLPTDLGNKNPVYNFAVARVRYDSSVVNAEDVRVFFRLIPALSTSVAYDQTQNYRRWSDGLEFGQAIPLLGIDAQTGEVVTIPCFSQPRIDASSVSLDTQTDPDNVQTIDAGGNSTTYAYYGCWLDINQPATEYPMNVTGVNPDGPFASNTLQTIQTLLRGLHQCLVAEIAYDPDPIPTGYSPSASGPLAQRNLSLVPVANPGESGSRRVPNTFTIRPTAAKLAPGERVDELMIDWGNVPKGSVASIYWPSVNTGDVIDLAATMYVTHNLAIADAHTLRMPAGGITYIPIPPGSGISLNGLITIDLPFGIAKGQSFDIVVRQVTNTSQPQPKVKAVAAPRPWRHVIGSFQITIPVKTREVMLAPEERNLSLVRWIQQTIPAKSSWYPVFNRYVTQIAERVKGLGGNPATIVASPNGGGKQSPQPCGKEHHYEAALEFTGKVIGLKYDRFGDFEGFDLRTEHGTERSFESREHEIEALAQRAWADRIVISVFAKSDEPHQPESIVLRRAPRPFQD